MYKQNKEKTKLKRFIYGIKIALNLPSLPNYINNFHNYYLIRIFKVIGGIFIILLLLPK